MMIVLGKCLLFFVFGCIDNRDINISFCLYLKIRLCWKGIDFTLKLLFESIMFAFFLVKITINSGAAAQNQAITGSK